MQIKTKKHQFLIFFNTLLTLICCSKREIPEKIFLSEFAPKVDGIADTIWKQIKFNNMYYYYGQQAEDSNDFNPVYKVLQYNDDLYFFVSVIDQIKFTHPKPPNPYDMRLWNLRDYDRVNFNFDADNDGKDDFGVSINYGIDSVFYYNISPADFKIGFGECSLGYNAELKIPLRLFKKNNIKFNFVVTDHDMKFHENGLDVFGIYESMYGTGCEYLRNI